MQTYTLPAPVVPNLIYDRVAVDRVMPDDINKRWTFLVYALPAGSNDPMPLIVQTLHRGVLRIEQMSVPYAALPAGLAASDLAQAITAAALAQLADLMTTAPEPQPEPEA